MNETVRGVLLCACFLGPACGCLNPDRGARELHEANRPRFLPQAGPGEGQATPRRLTLTARESVEHALAHSPRLVPPEAGLNIAKLNRDRAEWSLAPRLYAGASTGVNPLYIDDWTTDRVSSWVRADLDLLTSIFAYADIYSSRAGELRAEALLENFKGALALEVVKTFMALRKEERALGVLANGRVAAERRLKAARATFEAGLSEEIDLREAELALREITIGESVANACLREGQVKFKRLLGLGPECELVLVDDGALPETLPSEDDCLKLAYDNRKDLRAAELAVVEARGRLRVAWMRHLPTVTLTGGAGLPLDREVHGWEDADLSMGLSVSLPLFEGGNIQRGVRMARQGLDMAEHALNEFSEDIKGNIRGKRRALAEAETMLGLRRAQRELARQRLRIAEAQAEATGDEAPREQARSRLLQAEVDETRAYYDHAAAAAELRREVYGSPLPPAESQAK